MTYPNLSGDTQRLLADELRLGGFRDEDDVVKAALLALARQRRTIAAIDEGLEDAEAGRMQSREDFDRDFRRPHAS